MVQRSSPIQPIKPMIRFINRKSPNRTVVGLSKLAHQPSLPACKTCCGFSHMPWQASLACIGHRSTRPLATLFFGHTESRTQVPLYLLYFTMIYKTLTRGSKLA